LLRGNGRSEKEGENGQDANHISLLPAPARNPQEKRSEAWITNPAPAFRLRFEAGDPS
jgi:hypothetical protein